MTTTDSKIKYHSLPEDIRAALESSDIDDAIEATGKAHSLHIDQTGVLYGLVNAVLTGQVQPSQFVSLLEKELAVTKDQAIGIAKEVNQKVFLPIRDSLKKIHGVDKEAPSRETAPLEKKKDVIQAIEAPESVPMRVRVVEVSHTEPAPAVIPPAPPVAPAPTLPPTPVVVVPPPLAKPTPPVVEMSTLAPTPAPIVTPEAAPAPVVKLTPVVETVIAPPPPPVPAPAPAPVAETIVVPAAPAPAPTMPAVPKKPAPAPAPRAAGIDPYRELAA